jgi:hypothetical protein
MREAFLNCARDLKQLYVEGHWDTVEETELWQLMDYYLSEMIEDEKITVTIETILMRDIDHAADQA